MVSDLSKLFDNLTDLGYRFSSSCLLKTDFIRHLVKEHPPETGTENSGYCNDRSFPTSSMFDIFVFPSHGRIFSDQDPG